MRKFISAIAATAVALSALTMSVFATDYGAPPVYRLPQGETLAPSDVEDVITEALEAGSDHVVIDISEGSVVVSMEVLAVIAEAGVEVTFVVENGSVTIDGAELAGIDLPEDFRIVLEIDEDTGDIDVGEANVLVIRPDFGITGEFGFSVTITVDAPEGFSEGDPVFVYYVDDDGNVTLVDEAFVIDGEISITIDRASFYILSDIELDIEEPEVPQGPEGPQGPAGPEGPQGPAGPAGPGEGENPPTGVVATGLVSMAIAGTAMLLAKKRK